MNSVDWKNDFVLILRIQRLKIYIEVYHNFEFGNKLFKFGSFAGSTTVSKKLILFHDFF